MLGGAYTDNVRGVLLPVVAEELSISWGVASWFLVIGHVVAAAFSLVILRLIQFHSPMKLAFYASILGLLPMSFAHLVTSWPLMMVLAGLMGAAMVSLGNLANLLTLSATPPAFRGRILSGMHMMYGIGSLSAPLFASVLIERGVPWPWILAGAAPVLLMAMFFTGTAGTRGRDVGTLSATNAEQGVADRSNVSNGHRAKTKTRFGAIHLLVLLVFGSYVAGEVLAVMWLPAYLVEKTGMDIASTGPWVAVFFGLMGLSRLGCFFFSSPKIEKALLFLSLLVPVAAFVLGWRGWIWAFPLAGLCGPFFPLFLARISRSFSEEWQSLTVIVIIFVQLILVASHLILGNTIDWLGPQKAFLLPPMFMLMGVMFLAVFFRMERLRNRG